MPHIFHKDGLDTMFAYIHCPVFANRIILTTLGMLISFLINWMRKHQGNKCPHKTNCKYVAVVCISFQHWPYPVHIWPVYKTSTLIPI